jgi:hypothetical protein
MLYVQATDATPCPNCTMLAMDKVVQVDHGSTFALNQEMDSNVNMLATWNQWHTLSLQCNQQAGNPAGNGFAGGPQWQYDNQQGSWKNTGITYGCPLSTTQQTEVRFSMHWTNGDTSCSDGVGSAWSTDTYDNLTICIGGTNGVGGSCQDFTLNKTLCGYTEPTFAQKMSIQDQPDLTNTTTSGANPTTVTRSVWHNNATLAMFGTTQTSSTTFTFTTAATGPIKVGPAIRLSGQILLPH